MQTQLECIPCLLRQALDAARMVSPDEAFHARLLREVLAFAAQMDLTAPPPVLAGWIHGRVRAFSGCADPYAEAKREATRLAFELLPWSEARVRVAKDPFLTAVRLAIAGNIIDLGPTSYIGREVVEEHLHAALEKPLFGDIEALRVRVRDARRILYIADNAGELVFDRLLLQQLPLDRVQVVVRGEPIINDATRLEAEEAGIPALCPVTDTGSGLPGVVLDDCGPGFRTLFEQADLVIAKGQANYETLSDLSKGFGSVYCLFMGKCPVLCGRLGCEPGTLVARCVSVPPGQEVLVSPEKQEGACATA